LPVEADQFVPTTFLGLSVDAVSRLALHVGNAPASLGELFDVEDDGRDVLTLEGDLRHVRGVGRGMTEGSLVVRGAAGLFLGAGMTGGAIEVFGDVGDWAGAAMEGGRLHVHGHAGRSLGAAFPGARLGMRGGIILVDGSAGEEVGTQMRRGLLAVAGSTGGGLGRGMVAGSVFVFGEVDGHPGLGLKRGTIAILGERPPALLPSFADAGVFRFPFLAVYLKRLAGWGFAVPGAVSTGQARRYNGDLSAGGIGEILLRP
jgi:formylmethanofuran dehydrogenase subunit C